MISKMLAHVSRKPYQAILSVMFLLLCGCSGKADDEPRKPGRNAYIDTSMNRLSSCGDVHIDVIQAAEAAATGAAEGSTQLSLFSRNANYQGMEDNDLRGFLDGAYKEGWNQVSQAHLRLGRRARNPGYGEYELFRNLQRWDDLPIPSNAKIKRASLRLSLESGPPYPVDVAVYAARKDWNPGQGGTRHDNNSPPAKGEVWWLDAKYGEVPWASAGAGFASDDARNADTFEQPLAFARYAPGDKELVFDSDRIGTYVQSQIAARKPLLFLYKLVDHYEDSIGSVFEVWSANYGVAISGRRPLLRIEWQPQDVLASINVPLKLEAGRFIIVPNISTGVGTSVAASFIAEAGQTQSAGDSCGQEPFLEYRQAGTDWRALEGTAISNSSYMDLRITAAEKPLELGTEFTPSLRDTWIPVGAAEDHDVQWQFHRPDGSLFATKGHYNGDYTWQATVHADMLGRWTFQWQHELSGEPMQSELHVFDVVARELSPVIAGLKQLRDDIAASGASARSNEMLPFELEFMVLERAAVALLAKTPGNGDEAKVIHQEIKRLREILSGDEVPEKFHPEAIRAREADGNGH